MIGQPDKARIFPLVLSPKDRHRLDKLAYGAEMSRAGALRLLIRNTTPEYIIELSHRQQVQKGRADDHTAI